MNAQACEQCKSVTADEAAGAGDQHVPVVGQCVHAGLRATTETA